MPSTRGKRKSNTRIGGDGITAVEKQPIKSLRRWYNGTLQDRRQCIKIYVIADEGFKTMDRKVLPGKFKCGPW